MANNNFSIDIFGTAITISTDEDPGYLDKLLSKYRDKIEDVRIKSRFDDPLKLAVFTGFLLCDELEKAAASKEKKDVPDAEVEQITMGLLSRLEEILESPPKENPCESS